MKSKIALYVLLFGSFCHQIYGQSVPNKPGYQTVVFPDASKSKNTDGNTTSDAVSLTRRKMTSIPKTPNAFNKQGKVVVALCVNAEGNVVSAEYQPKGSTTTDDSLIKLSIKTAYLYKYAPSKVEKQCGKIFFNYATK